MDLRCMSGARQDERRLSVQVQTPEARGSSKFGIRVNPSLTVGLLFSTPFAEYTRMMNLDDSVLCTSMFKFRAVEHMVLRVGLSGQR